jgi:O-antigen ligase
MTSAIHFSDAVAASTRALPASIGRRLAALLVVAYSALVPVVVVPVGNETFSLCEPLLLLTAVALFFVRPMAPPRVHHIAMALYLTATLISLWQIGDGELLAGSGKRWVRLVAIAAPLYLPLGLEVSRQTVQRAIRAFLWGGLAAITIGLVLYWFQIQIRQESQKLWLGNGHSPILRASGLVADTAAFGHLVAVWAIVSLGSLWIGNHPHRFRWSLVAAALVLYTVVVSSSRGALVDILAGLAALGLLSRPRWRCRLDFVVLGLLVGSVALVGLGGFLLASGVQGPSGELQGSLSRFLGGNSGSVNNFSSGRLETWSSYLSDCADYLLCGTGYKTATFVLPGRFPDNALLGILVEAGVPGLACMLFFLGSVLWGLWKQRRVGNDYASLVFALWVGQIVHAMTADTFTLFSTMPFVYLLTAIVLQMPRTTLPARTLNENLFGRRLRESL